VLGFVHPQTAAQSSEALQQLCLRILEHTSCGSEFALSDFHLFRLLRDALRGHCFASGHELNEAVQMWLADQSETLFYDGILCNAGSSGVMHF
jgi:hypothetical protein